MKKLTLYIILILSNATLIYSQQSFIKTIPLNFDNEILSPIPSFFQINNSNQSSILFHAINTPPKIPLLQLNDNGSYMSGSYIHSPMISQIGYVYSFFKYDNYHIFITPTISAQTTTGNDSNSALIVSNPTENINWAKSLGNGFPYHRLGILNNGTIITSFNANNKLAICAIDIQDQSINWSQSLYSQLIDWQKMDLLFIESSDDNNIYLLGHNTFDTSPFVPNLTKLDNEGSFIKSIQITSPNIIVLNNGHFSIDQEENIYLQACYRSEPGALLEGVIIKFNSNLELVWAKILHAEAFPLKKLDISTLPNGETVFAYATNGNFPIISGKISPEGELLWHKGYSFIPRALAVSNDESIFFAEFTTENNMDYNLNIIKTDSNGDLPNDCPIFNTCLELIDIEVQTEDFEWLSQPAGDLEDIVIEVTPFDFSTEDFCYSPTPPSAEFTLPDTICQAECVFPTDLKNNLAHEVKWNILGPSFDTTIVDSVFTWCFEEAGEYLIEQEVWLLGCAEIMPHQLTVLSDDLALPLGEDISICMQGQTTHTLTAKSSRPLIDFEWSTGATTASIDITTTGTYGLIASDGYCDVEDVINVNFALEDIAPPYIQIPNDTLLCPDLLPLTFTPTSVYTDSFYINQQLVDNIHLSQTGTTTVTAFVNGCEVEKNIHLQVESCTVPIFIPNAFSPNDDGINDVVAPLGEDFDPISLQVYDRWGSLIFQTNHPPFRWNGQSQGKLAPTGVYLITFNYLNKRNLTEEIIARDVLLLK